MPSAVIADSYRCSQIGRLGNRRDGVLGDCVTEIREVLAGTLAGSGGREMANQAGVGPRVGTSRPRLDEGVARGGDVAELTDELVGRVAPTAWPDRPGCARRELTKHALCRLSH